jgi:2-amino-4-hydroxy-6-hydroxymethyldihydropteridine diphosphokinase
MRAVFSVGSNLGNRLGYLQTAVDVLAGRGARLAVSPVYETAPVGGPAQGDYLNAVVLADVPAGTDLLGLIDTAERAAGRDRGQRWGPRTLDLDVISVDDVVSTDPALTLPHPRAHSRAFVLAPWLDLDPRAMLPRLGPVADVLDVIGRSGIRRRDDLTLSVR